MTRRSADLSAADLAALARAGVPEAEARRQLALLLEPPPPARLVRPARAGDGVERIDAARAGELAARGRAARDAGRVSKFVPASGAATRMFRGLAAVLERRDARSAAELAAAGEEGDDAARETAEFLAVLPRLALRRPLEEALARDGFALATAPPLAVLERLLGETGLDAARLPKALLPFHETATGERTAFEEHLLEGAGYLRDRDGRCRFHFTIPPGSEARFLLALERASEIPDLAGLVLDVRFSLQHPASDTLALGENGRIARGADGAPRLRPSGHGALLANLVEPGDEPPDLVLVKNVDNVLPAPRHAEIAREKLVLLGRLLALEGEVHALQRALEAGRLGASGVEAALEFLAATFGAPAAARWRPLGPPARRALLADRLFRPLRVAGVVPNAGEPGGGPFWVAGADGEVTPQIVEASQVDPADAAQRAIWSASTHFNPVDLALSVRDAFTRTYDLERFVDASASFVATKHEGGVAWKVLERPGLWNGAMAGWNTVFVEVPARTFAPVKTVLDLARPEHRTR